MIEGHLEIRGSLNTEIEYRISEEYARAVFEANEGKRINESLRLVKLDARDARWTSLARLYSTHQGNGFYGWNIRRRYSASETKAAQLHLFSITAGVIPTGEECGTVYSDQEMCPCCGAGRVQVSPLRLRIAKTPRRAEIARTWGGEIIVSARIIRLLIDAQVTGFGLGPVQRSKKGEEEAFSFMDTPSGKELLYAALQKGIEYPSREFYVWMNSLEQREKRVSAINEHERKKLPKRRLLGGTSSDWYQLFVTLDPLQLAPATRIGCNPFDNDVAGQYRCPLGLRDHVVGLNLLSRVTAEGGDTWKDADFLRSRELVGSRRGLFNPRPLLFISPKLRDLLVGNSVKGWSSEVALVAPGLLVSVPEQFQKSGATTTPMNIPDPAKYPLCDYFLSGYLKANPNDAGNFPRGEFPDGFVRYEALFHDALFHLKMTKEALRSKQEFNFDSGNANNLESAIGVLRAATHLGQAKFTDITIIKLKRTSRGADLTAHKNSRKVCFEVKTITKQSKGRAGHFFADQLYEKIREGIAKAREQLIASSLELNCELTIYPCVVNWFAQTTYLNQADYQSIVNKLEAHGEEKSLAGVDGVWFILKNGDLKAFLNERAKVLDT